MSKLIVRTSAGIIDITVLSLALVFAFFLRFDWVLPHVMFQRLIGTLPYLVGLQYLLLAMLGVTRMSWRYIGLREATRILAALATATTVFLIARLVAGEIWHDIWRTPYALPIGVILIDFVLGYLGITGARVVRRLFAERREAEKHRDGSQPRVRTLLIGAGQGGVLVAKEISNRPDLGIVAVGFLDDDPMKQGTVIHGLRVLGSTDQLKAVCAKTGAKQALITFANAPGHAIRRVTLLCENAEIPVKIVPGVYEIVGGQVNLSRIRNVAIEDLLGREPVKLDERAIERVVRGRVILITGAGGSIGSELCRQVCGFHPSTLVLVERGENSLFHIHRELIEHFPSLTIVPCLADIGDADRMTALFAEHRPSSVFHAAAHKHVPMMEWNPGEAVKNNILGTRTLAKLADRFAVQEFVMISTDKAVNPTSVMGATKRVAEIYVQALSERSSTRFVTVRFGNVLGSEGSVIPTFQKQIATGGPVTITHPDMQRYFMTIPEACQLVVQAATMGRGGEIFILDMGDPVRIVDLAKDLIRLSGFRPEEDIEIIVTGIRPGEKLFEELSIREENATKTLHPKIYVGKLIPTPFAKIAAQVDEISKLTDVTDRAQLMRKLCEIVPEYSSPSLQGYEKLEQPSGMVPQLLTTPGVLTPHV